MEWAYVQAKRAPCVPILNGQTVDPADYFAPIVEGYAAMDTCLRRNADWLAAPDGPVARMAEMPVRFLHRSTHIYMRTLQQSLLPRHLRDGVRREIAIERLWKGHAKNPYAGAIFADEVNALRQLDSPMIQSLPGHTSAILNDGSIAENVFYRPALDGVLTGLRELPGTPAEIDIDEARSALFSVNPRPIPWVNDTGSAKSRQSAGAPDWLGAASAIGDFIYGQGIHASDGDLAWYGAIYYPWHDSWVVHTLGLADLVSGPSGLAVVMADLARVSGEVRHEDAAQHVLRFMHGHLASLPQQFDDYQQQLQAAKRPVFFCGGYYGPGIFLYTLARIAQALGDSAIANDVLAAVETIRLPLVETLSPADLIAGRAGLLMNLLALENSAQQVTLTDRYGPQLAIMADRLVAHLLADRDEHGMFPLPPYPQGAWVYDSLPGPQEGVHLALHRWRTCNLSKAGNQCVPDGLLPEAMNGKTSGGMLTLLAMLQLKAADDQGVAQHTQAYLACDPATLHSANVLEHLEVAITAFQVTQDERFYDAAAMFGGELVARHAQTDSWFPDILLADRHHLSAIHGLGAIAHAFLRLHRPQQVASLRLLS
jgi:lantibiotic modifying enzyme